MTPAPPTTKMDVTLPRTIHCLKLILRCFPAIANALSSSASLPPIFRFDACSQCLEPVWCIPALNCYWYPMSEDGGSETATKAMAVVDVEADAMYHVRLIHSWPPLFTAPALDQTLAMSFYGLQLELRGTSTAQDDRRSPIALINDGQPIPQSEEIRREVAVLLPFGSSSPPSTQLLASLDTMTGPFEVAVVGKAAAASTGMDEEALAALMAMASVQVDNSLLEINGERFLLAKGATGADVYRRLWVMASRSSLATPFELTLRRHNLPQASAKIVPFARRKDVQDAQIAQLAKLAAQEAALPLDVRRKKLFLAQQLDYERENYLVAYVSAPLQALHTSVMGSGEWQAYEFAKTLWYFHAPTARLRTEHPLRSHADAQKLLARVQQQVQQAVRRIQRRARSCQRRKRLMAVIQAEVRRRQDEKQKEQQLQDAVRRIQRRVRAYRRRKRFLAMLDAEKRRLEQLRRAQQAAEARRREEERAEESRQLEAMRHEQRRLQQQVEELKLELQRVKDLRQSKVAVQSETQTSARREEDGAIDRLRKEEQQRVQERLGKLELELKTRRAVESQTQTSSRSAENEAEQQRAQERVDELQRQPTKALVESVTQTSGRGAERFQDEGVDTGDDLEWQRYLTLLRVSIKNKKKASPKSRHTQTENVDGEESLLPCSTLRAPLSTASRQASGDWKGFPSWQRGGNNSSSSSLQTLKSSLSQLDELDAMSLPSRTFEAFFAPELMLASEQPPPPLVEHPWRQDAAFLPLKSSRRMLEVAPVHQPPTLQLHEYQEPIRPIRVTGNASPLTHQSPSSSSPASSPTKLPYITRRRNKFANSPT
jgi:hypothetical protein